MGKEKYRARKRRKEGKEREKRQGQRIGENGGGEKEGGRGRRRYNGKEEGSTKEEQGWKGLGRVGKEGERKKKKGREVSDGEKECLGRNGRNEKERRQLVGDVTLTAFLIV